jgi:hypothetical protein
MKTIIIAICALALTTYVIFQSNTVKQPVVQQSAKKTEAAIKFLEQEHNFAELR